MQAVACAERVVTFAKKMSAVPLRPRFRRLRFPEHRPRRVLCGAQVLLRLVAAAKVTCRAVWEGLSPEGGQVSPAVAQVSVSLSSAGTGASSLMGCSGQALAPEGGLVSPAAGVWPVGLGAAGGEAW